MSRMIAALLALLLIGATPADARTILFVGNSFTFGALSPVQSYRPASVTDLNGTGIGGVPALFSTFAEERGLDWRVSLETIPGSSLADHWRKKQAVLAGAWEVVVLQGYSALDKVHPGDPAEHVRAAGQLAGLIRRDNPMAKVFVVSSWSRADLTYKPSGHWYHQPITAMADDIAAANALALSTDPDLAGDIPVGAAWNRAIAEGAADPNPYDGIAPDQVDLWAIDHYHASSYGYYLEALMMFGTVTGEDPRALGDHERAALDLGFSPALTGSLQRIAAAQLIASGKITDAAPHTDAALPARPR